MNKSWLALIIIGVLFLLGVIGWEAYQNLSGARSNINIALIEYQRETLFSPGLEAHLNSDTKFIERESSTEETTFPNSL